MNDKVRAVAYFRMSSSQQEQSIPQQKKWAEAAVKLAEIEILREFEDHGRSGGGTRGRDDFGEMLRWCEARHKDGTPVDAIVCWDTSRFSRMDSMETAFYIYQFQRVGVHRVFTHERWYDFRKEEDRVIFLMQQDFTNNRYLRDHSARVTRGKRDNLSSGNGYHNGGNAAYGFDRLLLNEKDEPVQRFRRYEQITFRLKGWNVKLVPAEDLEEVETVRWLFHRYATADVSLRSLAAELTRKGIPAPGKRVNVRVPAWNAITIRHILTNPHYVGDYVYGRKPSGKYNHVMLTPDGKPSPEAVQRGAHDGLIDRATWEAVQRKMIRRKKTGETTHCRGMILSGGLLHCGHCGRKMYGSPSVAKRQNGSSKEYRYYICPTYMKNPGLCRRFSMREDKLLPFLIRKLEEVYLDPGRLEGLRKCLKDRAETRHQTDPVRAERLRKKMAAIEQDIRQGARNLVRATDNLDLIQAELTTLRAERQKLARELEGVEREQVLPVEHLTAEVDNAIDRLLTIKEQFRKLKDAPHKAKPEKLREVIRLLVSRVDLYWDEAGPSPSKTWFHFAKGIIKVRPVLEIVNSHEKSL
jgi:DNA invertase Pin-like site-specific DNA recombinase